MHVEPIHARESKQANSGREIPSSPEIRNSDNDPLEDYRVQNQAACWSTLSTSQEQPVPGNGDDDSYRPAPSELDAAEITRGDTPLDVDVSNDSHRTPNSPGKDLRGQTHIPPDQETVKQAAKSHPCTGELRDKTGQGQKHRAYNEPKGPQTHLYPPKSSTQAPTAKDADRFPMATGELDNEPAFKRPRNARTMASSLSEPEENNRGVQYHCPQENVHTEEQPALPSLSYDLKRQKSGTNDSPSDDRSQTLMFAPMEGFFRDQSPGQNSESYRPEDPHFPDTPFTRPINRLRMTSPDLEVSQPLSSRMSGPPRSPRSVASSIGMSPMRFWVLVRKHPKRSWKNLPDTTFLSQSLDLFYSSINSQVDIGGCPSIELTLSMADEDWTFSLPKNDENHFEKMKAFVMQKSGLSQPAQKGEPMALDVYLVP